MPEKKIALWKRIAGYAAFSVFALLISMFITFPYETLRSRVSREADAAGYTVRISSLGPGFFSLRASGVELAKKVPENSDQPIEALQIDSISVGPTLFPPGLGVRAKLLGGVITGRLSALGKTSFKVEADELDLSKGNMKGFSGIDFAGTVNGKIELTLPKSTQGPPEPDLGMAKGSVSLETQGLVINGGTMMLKLPAFGPEPTPFDLPRIALGEINGKVKFEKGAGTIEEFKSKSTDLEAALSGTVKLAKRVEYSETNLEVRFKPDPDFQKRLGPLGMGLSMVGPDPKDPSWRMGRMTGLLSSPNFR